MAVTELEIAQTKLETIKHIERVRSLLSEQIIRLLDRMSEHDASKLGSPEAEVFAEFTPKLRGSTYGSDEYKSFLAQMKPALDHHYANNSHHPENHPNGVDGMTLLDLVEMLVDWKAASERHADGCIHKSIDLNTKRFNLSGQLASILGNTARANGW